MVSRTKKNQQQQQQKTNKKQNKQQQQQPQNLELVCSGNTIMDKISGVIFATRLVPTG